MKQRLHVITLGVDDLERSLKFYRDGMGLKTEGIFGADIHERGAVVFYNMENGLILATWPRANMAWDSDAPQGAASATEFTIGHGVASREEVDEVIAQARAAGANIPKAPHDTFYGGYAGYFQDPDGHLWEVMWNPALNIKD
jgi:catechol 2,3-dioxygenase-like lactoylglutathione lyase family enzyme